MPTLTAWKGAKLILNTVLQALSLSFCASLAMRFRIMQTNKYRYGIRLSRKLECNEAALNEFLEYVTVLDWPEQAAPEYGRIRAHLKKKGTPIGTNDLLIAAHILALDAVLVKDNVREFERISSLKMEKWISR